ncbi:uncharacterized protein LOC127740522 [Arachis duranensis]|uniref:Uncharacterized protein LOC127740522 n=1 Tax=Arachis duranensis TaxID=130453 RepID=A0A9C6T0E5_ARADU|nr:uncharacterized protein LOC127740522 [Arachis duranensis]
MEERDLLECCGSIKFASEMASASPFSSLQHALDVASNIWCNKLNVHSWLIALNAHTNICEKSPFSHAFYTNIPMDSITEKQCLQNARNRERLIVSHAGGSKSNARRATQMEKKLGRPVCRSEVIVSTLLKKDGSYVSGEGQQLAEKIAEHLSEDQERAAAEGMHSKVLAHPDDAIGKVCGPENGKRVRGFSNAAYPSGFGKSKRIFGGAICGGSSSASQQHVAELEKQLQEAKGQVATLYRFLQQKYGDEVPTLSESVPHIESE